MTKISDNVKVDKTLDKFGRSGIFNLFICES